MKFLFISPIIPEDLRVSVHGIYKRMGLFIEAIKDIAQIDILFYVHHDKNITTSAISEMEQKFSEHWNAEIRLFLCPRFQDTKKMSRWEKLGAPVLNIYNQMPYKYMAGPRHVAIIETCLNRKPDAIFAHRLSAMMPLCLTKKKLPPVFFDLDDIEHISFFREIGQPPRYKSKPLLYLQLPALFLGEMKAIRLASQTFICSDHDRKHLQRICLAKGLSIVPNSIDIPELKTLTKAPTLLFIGGYKYWPNIRAAEFLIKTVLPIIHQKRPDVCLIIAGSNPDRISCYSHNLPGVKFAGFIDNLDELYERIRVVCCPIFSGGGTRFKIIEAAAYAKPIVATTIGAEGLNMEEGKEIMLRDDPQAFANACITLLKDSAMSRRMGLAAREKAIRFYDRANIVRLIQQHIINSMPTRSN